MCSIYCAPTPEIEKLAEERNASGIAARVAVARSGLHLLLEDDDDDDDIWFKYILILGC